MTGAWLTIRGHRIYPPPHDWRVGYGVSQVADLLLPTYRDLPKQERMQARQAPPKRRRTGASELGQKKG
jgi:hypothetical protein